MSRTMKQKIEVTSQTEFEACVAAGNTPLVTKGEFEAWGNATVEARGDATVHASGYATVYAWDNATVYAWDNASVHASANASVHASANATVHASANATVEAWDDATVDARDNATVDARDSVFIRLYGALHITATPTVIIAMHGTAQSIDGGRQIPIAPTPETGAECG